ncbi:MAG: flagellar hook-length control protein FliK [Clostridium sp.]|nr:flagellar hook-length control protein FliK [Clostridium sp.]
MNIFGQNLHTMDARETIGSRMADAMRSAGQERIGMQAGSEMAASDGWKPGQMFSGQITDITAQDVTILLDNQQLLHARMGEAVELSIGQQLLFQVKEHQGDQVIIRPMEPQGETEQNAAAMKALAANGLTASERNVGIANALMEAGMPLDRAHMQKVMQQAVRFPEADVKQLVAMNRLELPVTEETIRQYAQYTKQEHQLSGQIGKAVQSFLGETEGILQNQTPSELQVWNQQLTELFGWKPEMETESIDSKVASTGTEQSKQGPAEPAVSRKLSEAVRQLLAEAGLSEEQIRQAVKPQKTTGQFLTQLTQMIQQAPDQEAVSRFMKSGSYLQLLEKGIQEEWTLDPKTMKEPQEIDRLYQKLFEQSEKLSEQLKQFGGNGSSYQEQSGNMRENLQFMQQLNQQFVYAQLPMRMNEQDANSELYVYANRKKLQQGKDGVKVLLHLDMPHLGSTDILVRLKDKKLHADFTMADETAVSLVADNIEELAQKLTKKGYVYTNRVEKAVKQTDIDRKERPVSDPVVDEMFQQDLTTGQTRYTFDMRG